MKKNNGKIMSIIVTFESYYVIFNLNVLSFKNI